MLHYLHVVHKIVIITYQKCTSRTYTYKDICLSYVVLTARFLMQTDKNRAGKLEQESMIGLGNCIL
jgi:hypothetical protein